jgi:hypothetical protein
VTFPAGADTAEVPILAFGDDVNDVGETVTLTVVSGYRIDAGAGGGTVTICDQPLTVSVLSDGVEGGET